MIPGITASRIKRVATPSGDPYWANVVLLANLNVDFSDASTKGKVLVPSGNAAIVDGALRLDGSADWLSTVDGMEDFRFGTGDFSVELFAKTSISREVVLLDYFRAGGGYWQMEITSKGTPYWYSPQQSEDSAINVRDNKWHHIAFAVKSGRSYFFIDGVLVKNAVHTSNYNSTSLTKMSIGAQVDQRNSSYDFGGEIKGVRITKGSARGYTANFMPPPFPLPVGL